MPLSSDSFPRGPCLFSLPSILIGNWSHCWRKLEFPPPPLCPWNVECQITWGGKGDHLDLSPSLLAGPWGSPPTGDLGPSWYVGGPRGGDMLETCSPAPHTGSHSTNCCQSPAETPCMETEIGHICLTVCPPKDIFVTKIGACLLPLSPPFFLLLLPHALPFSFAHMLMTFVNCTLCVRNLGGNLNMVPNQHTLVSILFITEIGNLSRNRSLTMLSKVSL